MTRLALDRALATQWIDEVFEHNRQRQYPRELLFSSVVELMTLVTLGLRPSLHAAARKMADRLPVSLSALYAKVKRTEPALLRALVRGSAQRLSPVVAGLEVTPSLPGWKLRIIDGNHLPASDKRLAPLRGLRGAALPGHTVVVYDPDSALVCDIVACEDAYESERVAAAESGDQTLALWSNLPGEIDAATLARLYRKRWRIEGMFGRLESVLNSEIKTLGHPRAALLGFAVAVLAYNVLSLLKAVTEQAHRATHPQLEVSTYHLAVEIASTYESMLLILAAEHLPCADDDPQRLLQRLLLLASRLGPRQLTTSKRGPKTGRTNAGDVSGSIARSHVSTARVLKESLGVTRKTLKGMVLRTCCL